MELPDTGYTGNNSFVNAKSEDIINDIYDIPEQQVPVGGAQMQVRQ